MKPVQVQQLIEIIKGIAGEFSPCDEFTGVSIDSRTVKPGDLFWAVSGNQSDGSEYSEQALKNGAIGVVVSRQYQDQVVGPKIIVEDTLSALQQFGKWYRNQFDLCVIGVTGSAGKTTTREMIYSVLSEKMVGVRSSKNYNNHLGVPLTLLDIEPDHQFAIIEMGASSVGEIKMLADLASPQMGVVTGIGPSHLEGFGTLEDIVQAKAELLEALSEDGRAFISSNKEYRSRLSDAADCPVVTVGQDSSSDIQAVRLSSKNNQLQFSVDQRDYKMSVSGVHFVDSAMFAIAIGTELGMLPEEIARGLEKVKPVSGRCQVNDLDGLTLIDDTYNSSPDSLEAALKLLSTWETAGRKILVTGDMLELGDSARDYHNKSGYQIADNGIGILIACGEFASEVIAGAASGGMPENSLVTFEKADDQLCEYLKSILKQDDIVLVKGSRGMKMEKVVNDLCQTVQQSDSPLAKPEKVCA